jgi:thioredoxin reductase (NADPH)
MAARELHAVAYPTLDEAQIAALGRCAGASLQHYRAGKTLFQVGERDFKFFVIESGEVEILDESGEAPRTVTVHRPGEFTGDVAQLTGSPSVVSAVARTDCDVYEVSADALREVLSQCPDLSDVILQAFIARRQLLREAGNFTGLRVIGSRHSQDTFRIRDFLARNRVLFTRLAWKPTRRWRSMHRKVGSCFSSSQPMLISARIYAAGRWKLVPMPKNASRSRWSGIASKLISIT